MGRLYRRSANVITAATTLLLFASVGHAQPLEDRVDPAKIFRPMNHFIVNEERANFELTESPQPFLDWGLINAGFVEYVGKDTKQIVPVGDPHPYQNMDDIEAVQFGGATGMRLRVEKPTIVGNFDDVIGKTHPWEQGELEVVTLIYDEEEQLYRVWYKAGMRMAYAESKDFKTWNKPLRDLTPVGDSKETNLIGVTNVEQLLQGKMQLAEEIRPGASGAFFIDPTAPKSERFKTTFLAHTKTPHYDDKSGKSLVGRPVSAMTGPGSTVIWGAVSADGMAWRVLPEPVCYHDADTQTVTKYDTQIKKYVVYTRLYELGRRTIARLETDNFRRWPLPVNIMTPGPTEPPSLDYYANAFSFYPGQPDIRLIFCLDYDRARDIADIRLATSRDGRVFHFSPGEPIVTPAKVEQVGHGMVSPKPGLVRLPDGSMFMVYGAWRVPHKFPRANTGGIANRYADLCAQWPADRIVALEAEEFGEFASVPFTLRGNSIELNMLSDRTGGVKVEARDEKYEVIPGHSFADADVLYGDHAGVPVTWNGKSDLGAYRDKTIYLTFRLKSAKLYSIKAGSQSPIASSR
jgi:hypothetical protein